MAYLCIKVLEKWKLIMNLQYYRYYLTLSKNEKMFKTTNQTKKTKENEKKKNTNKRKKKFPLVGIEPQTIDV